MRIVPMVRCKGKKGKHVLLNRYIHQSLFRYLHDVRRTEDRVAVWRCQADVQPKIPNDILDVASFHSKVDVLGQNARFAGEIAAKLGSDNPDNFRPFVEQRTAAVARLYRRADLELPQVAVKSSGTADQSKPTQNNEKRMASLINRTNAMLPPDRTVKKTL